MASDLRPKAGIDQEWITSFEEISIRVGTILGITRELFVVSERILFEFIIEHEIFLSKLLE